MSTQKDWVNGLILEFKNTEFPQGIECGEGWSVLIYPILEMIERHNTAFPKHKISVDQVKEKWGAMRFYISMSVPSPEHNDLAEADSYSHIQGAIVLAEKVSLSLCEKCGQRGEIVKGSWLKVRCPSCKEVSRSDPVSPLGETADRMKPSLWTWGDRLTPQEAKECAEAAGDPRCQACGVKWEDHHQFCEGSNLSDEQKLLMETEHRLRMKRAGVAPKEGAD